MLRVPKQASQPQRQQQAKGQPALPSAAKGKGSFGGTAPLPAASNSGAVPAAAPMSIASAAQPASAAGGRLRAAAVEFQPGPAVGGPPPPAAAAADEYQAPLCPCHCTVHPLFANCTACGKILCQREAGTACTFCGAPLRGGAAALARVGGRLGGDDAADTAALAAVTAPQSDASLAAAVAHKNRLLEYQATSAARSFIYDDDADYFTDASSTWLTADERAAAARAEAARKAALHTRRREVRIALDFAGRSVEVRDVDAEAEAEKAARLSAVADGRAGAARLGAAVGTAAPGGAAPTSAGPAGGTGGDVGDAAGNEQLFPTGPGARAFANPTLTGRAAEIYSSILEDAAASRAAAKAKRRQGGVLGGGVGAVRAH
jgi:hypothetical protein